MSVSRPTHNPEQRFIRRRRIVLSLEIGLLFGYAIPVLANPYYSVRVLTTELGLTIGLALIAGWTGLLCWQCARYKTASLNLRDLIPYAIPLTLIAFWLIVVLAD